MSKTLNVVFTVFSSFILCVGESRLQSGRDDDVCDIRGTVMTCRDIPQTVPEYVKSVVVTYHIWTLENKFKGKGWKHVEKLQINGTTNSIEDEHLAGLDNVRELSFTFPNFVKFSRKAFAVTPKVTKLSLMRMHGLFTNTLFDALSQSGVLKNLSEFVFNPGSVKNQPKLSFSEEATNQLLEKPLTLLNISNSVILGRIIYAVKLLIKVDIVNISGSNIISTDEFVPLDLKSEMSMPLLKVLDISGTTSDYRSQISRASKMRFFESIMFKIEHIYADSFIHKANVVSKSYNLTRTDVFLKTFILRRNMIQKINCTCILNLNNSFEVLDISENKIEYISPNLANALHLKFLYLSQNNLFAMEHSTDFRILLSNYKNLVVLHMDRNNISSIPWDMFVYSQKLEVLNLAYNRLPTINFNLKHLSSLRILDIRSNFIYAIEGIELAHLKTFVQEIMKIPRGKNFQLMLQGNPLKCTCRSLDFIRWIYSYVHNNTANLQYVCQYGHSTILITKEAVNKCQFLCKRNLIIGVSTSGSIALCAVISAVFIGCWKARKRRKMQLIQDGYQRAYRLGLLNQQYACFVAYASHDEEIVRQMLLNPLGDTLKTMLATDRDTVATGYNFKPGFPIHEETYRVVQQSSVFIAVVSDAFCESQYCVGEVNEACSQQKPIIVVLHGRVKEENMSPYLLEVFRRKARASLSKTDNGHFDIIPDLNTLSKSVISLAMDSYEMNGTNER